MALLKTVSSYRGYVLKCRENSYASSKRAVQSEVVHFEIRRVAAATAAATVVAVGVVGVGGGKVAGKCFSQKRGISSVPGTDYIEMSETFPLALKKSAQEIESYTLSNLYQQIPVSLKFSFHEFW